MDRITTRRERLGLVLAAVLTLTLLGPALPEKLAHRRACNMENGAI